MLSLIEGTKILFITIPLSLSVKDLNPDGRINKIAYEWIKHYLNEHNEYEVSKC